MFYLISISLIILSVTTYPYIDIPLFIFIYGVLSYMDYRWIVVGFLSLLFIDVMWGRLFLFSSLYYAIFLFVMYRLFRTFPVLKDYGFVIFTFLYVISVTLFHLLFNYSYVDLSEALLWGGSQILFSLVILVFLSFIERYKQKKSYLSTKNIKNSL